MNYYEGWSEAELLKLRREIQEQRHQGPISEIRLAGESTTMDTKKANTHDKTIVDINYALFLLYKAGQTDTVYADPNAVITIQSHY